MNDRRAMLFLLLAAPLAACSSAYYATMESFGKSKRHIMVDRVEEAQEEQAEAKEQIQSTLDRFKELTGVDGGELESAYRRFAGEYDDCVDQAAAVSDRIDSIEDVAADLFEEWRQEIEEIQNPSYRAESGRLLRETQDRYGKMLQAMRAAEAKMEPVLAVFKDQVLYLKHNLNAQMIASLEDTVLKIEGDVSVLIAEMERSIAEANSFIAGMQSS